MSAPVWSTALPDWERRIVAGESLIGFEPLYPAEAKAALDVFKSLRIVDAPGSPTMGEACEQWVFGLVAAIFGAYDGESGRRLIQEALLLISKKNSKSTIAAGVMLTALIRNWRQSAELSILAPTVEVANNSFYPARDMVLADPRLASLIQVQEHYRKLTHRKSKAMLSVIAADEETVGGKKAGMVLVDELWLFGKRPNAENMLREATGGLASRPEGFVLYLSTQSDEPPAGVFRQKLIYARNVRDGRVKDDRFLPVLYEFPKAMIDDESFLAPENFRITNPNLNVSVDGEFLERELSKAQEAGKESLCGFMSKHLNVEIGMSLRSDRWAGADFWLRQAKKLTLDDLIERCEVIDVGIDGGGLDDLLGIAAVGRDMVTREWLCWTHAFAHPSVLERRKSEAARLRDFERAGDLTIVDKIGEDIDGLADFVEKILDAGLLDKIGVDQAGIGAIVDELVARGVNLEREIVGISQGWKLYGAIQTAERKLAEGKLWHAGQELMAWCVGNARVEPRGNAFLITKQTSGRAKIDPLMAMFNAVQLISLDPPSRRGVELFFVGGPAQKEKRRAA
jgi:phage terminase large subunit-like protein